MASVAVGTGVNLPREGRLGSTIPLPRLLGLLGVVGASGVLDIKRKKLVRRFVLEAGRIDALVSNARDDRFLDWVLARRDLRTDRASRLAALGEHSESTLTASLVIAESGATPDEVADWQRAHLVAILTECCEWRDATFSITPGHVGLGDEPRATLPAADAALTLARATKAARRPRAPQVVRALVERSTLTFLQLAPAERAVLELCAKARATNEVPGSATAFPRTEIDAAIEVLAFAGLLAEAELPKATVAMPEGAGERAATEADVLDFLAAASREDFCALLGVSQTASPDEVRKAYYRRVWRFHPDRFREGALVHYLPQIEAAFRVLNEGLDVLSNPEARERWEKRKVSEKRKRDPAQAAMALLSSARKAAQEGRRVEASELLERAIERGGGDASCRAALACLLLGNPRRRDEAVALLGRVAAENPSRADLAATYALVLRKTGQSAAAEQTLARARALDPSDHTVKAALGQAPDVETAKSDPFLAPLLS